MSDGSLKQQTAKGLFWGGLGSGFQQIVQLVFGIIMLNILTPEDYGIVGVLAVFTALALVIQDGGFTSALINKKEIKREDYNAVFWFSILTSVFLYLLLFLAAPLIAGFFDQPELVLVARVLFLSFLIGGIGVAQHAFILKELMVKEKVKIESWALLTSGLLGILFAFLGYTYWALVIQNIAYFGVTVMVRWYYCPWKPSFHITFRPLRSMFSFSIKLFLTNIFNRITENILPVILGKFYDERQVGFYVQGNKYSVMGGGFIMNMIHGVAQPVLTRMTDNKERQQNAFRKMIRFGAFLSFPLLLGLGFVSEEFFRLVGRGDKWLAAVPFLQLFCIWYSARYLWNLYTNLLIARGKSNIYMIGMIVVGSIQLLVVWLMFPLGIFPMLIVYLSVFFLGLLFWHYFAHKLIGLRGWDVIKDISPYLFATAGSILITWLITSGIEQVVIRFVLKVVITAVLYTAIMWYSNSAIARESFDYLKGLLNKK